MKTNSYWRMVLPAFVILMMLSFGMSQAAAFQDDSAAQQELIGTVNAFEGTVMIVDGQVFDVSSATIGEGVSIGEMVIVLATTTDSGIWLASSVELFVEQPVITITLAGAIEAIDGNIISLGGFEVFIDTDDPVLALLEVGTEVTIVGEVSNEEGRTIIIALSVIINDETEPPDPDDDPLPDGDVIIVIEGPVEAININIITIFDFDIELPADDPNLTIIQIGDVIRIEGIPTGDISVDGHLTIIAINIVIINVDIIVVDDGGDSPNPGPPRPPSAGFSKDDCKRGGWQNLTRPDGSGFRNQGDCVSFTNTGR